MSVTLPGPDYLHVGRGFTGHRIEDECPCPKEPCQLVTLADAHPDCTQHTFTKTIRQAHLASECPAGGDDT